MNVLVDTSVWSMALRRARPSMHGAVDELRALIDEGRAALLGPVRQELLSGVARAEQFELLRERLAAFPDVPITTVDYERAASCHNRCRAKGIQGSNTDFLVCAVALNHRLPIYSLDGDFAHFKRALPIVLHEIRK